MEGAVEGVVEVEVGRLADQVEEVVLGGRGGEQSGDVEGGVRGNGARVGGEVAVRGEVADRGGGAVAVAGGRGVGAGRVSGAWGGDHV